MNSQVKRLAALVLALALSVPAVAAGLSLDDAKRQGLVGEQYDGYLGAVDAGNSEANRLVDAINGKRRSEYQRIARSNQIAVGDVEALAGKKALERSAGGSFVKGPDGRWRRK